MTMMDRAAPSAFTALSRGARGRCPHCGEGRILHRYLEVADRCSVCDEPYGHFRADDAPPWLTILLVGHLAVPIILMIEQNFAPPVPLQLLIYMPLTVLLTLALLPRCKGVILALLWATKAEGSEPT
jgi:uncharacterized protein (DUF983 family)